jgi:hypothetical protein
MKQSYDDGRTRDEIERLIDIKVSQTLIEAIEKARQEGIFWVARRICPRCEARQPRQHVTYVLHDGKVVDTEMHPGDEAASSMVECLAAGFINGPQGDESWTH